MVSSSCKNVVLKNIKGFKNKKIIKAGDILLVEVLVIGNFDKIETGDGKMRKIKRGDKLLLTQANRYATKFQEVKISNQKVILASLGGIVGIVKKKNNFEYTNLKILGYAFSEKNVFLNIKNFKNISLEKKCFKTSFAKTNQKTKIITVFGSDMDVGKTTCATNLITKYTDNDLAVNYGKITGTSRMKDLLNSKKAGAKLVMDFNDCGYASTYKISSIELKEILQKIHLTLKTNNPDYIIFEIADGLLQREVQMILKDKILNKFNPIVYFCCREALSAGEALRIFKRYNLKINFISGLIMSSDLKVQEIKKNFNINCFNVKK